MNWDTSKVTNMANLFSNAGYNATTWYIGNISGWSNPNCNAFGTLGSAATTALAPVKTAWGCS
ncbi:MAG: hypothetical protein PHS24_00635 [Bacilli bacterium]|nr:hypothetical protein [Bacilli bacterium]